uniref:Uncharacterized protein n=1 Tax=Geospiza parvula TaxID=87175 RepID=A0A8C3NI93_GEOPR
MAQAVSVGELGLPQLELLKGQLEQEVEFLSSSLAQLKVVQTKFVEAKECLNVLHKGNEDVRARQAAGHTDGAGGRGHRLLRGEVGRRRPGVFQAQNRIPDAADGENPTGPAGEARHETGRAGDDDAEAAAADGGSGGPGGGQGVAPSPKPCRGDLGAAAPPQNPAEGI